MAEREIIGEEGSEGFTRVKCEHCGGTGKCKCYPCMFEEAKFQIEKRNLITLASEDLIEVFEGKNTQVRCHICNGFGFLFVDNQGNVKKPSFKDKEEK